MMKPEFVPNILEFNEVEPKYKGRSGFLSEVIDGYFYSIYYKSGKMGICNQNELISKKNLFYWTNKNNLYYKALKRQGIINLLNNKKRNIVIQGYFIGPGIKNNRFKIDKITFYCSRIYDIDLNKFMDYYEWITFCTIQRVLTIPVRRLNYCLEDYSKLQKEANKFSYLNSQVIQKGIAWQPYNLSISIIANNPNYLSL